MDTHIEMPSLGGLYARAALDAARSKLSSRAGPRSLPRETLVARHPGVSVGHADHYRRLFGGEAFDGAHRMSLPSVLVHIISFPVQMALMAREDFPLPLMGIVHISNEVDHRHRISVGQPVQIRVGAENMRAHRRGTQVDIVVEVLEDAPKSAQPRAATHPEEGTHPAEAARPEGEQVLWRGVSTYLSRGIHLVEDPPSSEVKDGARDFTPPMKTASWRLGAGTGRDYAGVSGDYNPIHVSAAAAKALGMPSAIVHGMYSAGRMLEGREPESAGHRWSISFEAPIVLPGTVAFAAEHLGPDTVRFVGWDPRRSRRHFHGELHLS